jgi:hypothetical protein
VRVDEELLDEVNLEDDELLVRVEDALDELDEVDDGLAELEDSPGHFPNKGLQPLPQYSLEEPHYFCQSSVHC